MLELKGTTKVEYFHVDCAACGKAVRLKNLRWVGGVPQVEAACPSCKETGDFKLHFPTWIEVAPPMEG